MMVGMFVCLCLASQKSSEREFFVPARTDFGVLKSCYKLPLTYNTQIRVCPVLFLLPPKSQGHVSILTVLDGQQLLIKELISDIGMYWIVLE